MCFCAQDGCTALHLSAHKGGVDVVRLLTEAQAQVNIQTKVKWILTLNNLTTDKVTFSVKCRD